MINWIIVLLFGINSGFASQGSSVITDKKIKEVPQLLLHLDRQVKDFSRCIFIMILFDGDLFDQLLDQLR